MRTMPRIFIGLAVSLAQLVTTAALAQDSYDSTCAASILRASGHFAIQATPPMDPVAAKTTTYDSSPCASARMPQLPLNSRVAG